MARGNGADTFPQGSRPTGGEPTSVPDAFPVTNPAPDFGQMHDLVSGMGEDSMGQDSETQDPADLYSSRWRL